MVSIRHTTNDLTSRGKPFVAQGAMAPWLHHQEVKGTSPQQWIVISTEILWMEEILHHLGWLKHVETV
jgi:hypothetical protein